MENSQQKAENRKEPKSEKVWQKAENGKGSAKIREFKSSKKGLKKESY